MSHSQRANKIFEAQTSATCRLITEGTRDVSMKRIIRNVADCVILGLFAVGCSLPVVILAIPHSRLLPNFDLTIEAAALFVAFVFGVCLGIWRIRNARQS